MVAETVEESTQLKGLVFNIERFCIHDGPGIRTVVFLKGCPLSCRWCANPEGKSRDTQIMFHPERCIGCGQCVAVCTQGAAIRTPSGKIAMRTDRCVRCSACVAVCPSRARIRYGNFMTVSEVFSEIHKDYPFYRRSGGGVTLSGGEPLLQDEFTRRLLVHCADRNVHTAVETCGYADGETLFRTLSPARLILFDLKHVHPLKHLKVTGVDNRRILDNLRRLDGASAPLAIRVPVVPGFNATATEMRMMAEFVSGLTHPPPCHLLPFHTMAAGKYERLGMADRFFRAEVPSQEQMESFRKVWEGFGLTVQIGG